MTASLLELRDFEVSGVPTTIPAHLQILATDEFTNGSYYTKFVEDEMSFVPGAPTTAPTLPEDEELEERSMTVEVGGKRFVVRFWAPVMAAPASGGARPAPRRRPPKLDRGSSGIETAGVVTAPMQGTIVKVYMPAGTHVEVGEPLCVLEAMKMENEIKAPIAGELVDLRIQPGDTVASGAVLAIIR